MDRLRDTAFGFPKRQNDYRPVQLDDTGSFPTPGEIGRQIGLVVAVCLGLGLLARVIVAFVGVY